MIAKYNLKGEELETTDITGLNLKQLREVISKYGIEPETSLRDADQLEKEWRAHLESKNVDWESHDL